MSDGAQREWKFYLDDMIAFAGKVMAYTESMPKDRFLASGINYDATLRNLELIGEAATRIPEDIRAQAPASFVPAEQVTSTVLGTRGLWSSKSLREAPPSGLAAERRLGAGLIQGSGGGGGGEEVRHPCVITPASAERGVYSSYPRSLRNDHEPSG